MHALDQTIAAVSTPAGSAWRGLIRVTGPQTAQVLNAMLDMPPTTTRQLTPAHLTGIWAGLPCMVTRFDAPASFTGQDCAELFLPGNPALLEQVISQICRTGLCTHAEPGEFSWRAFRHGKISLEQAEGLLATLEAHDAEQLKAAAALRHGELSRSAARLTDTLANCLALTEAGVDFSEEEDVHPISPAVLYDTLMQISKTLTQLLHLGSAWQHKDSLPRVVLIGPPSSGKSSLFNALLDRNRAVTSEEAGTTRDAIEVEAEWQDANRQAHKLMLVDTAGIAERSLDRIDAQAQQTARATAATADLCLLCGDLRTEALDLDPASTLMIHTKADMSPAPQGTLAVSALNGKGLNLLRETILARLQTLSQAHSQSELSLLPRHLEALESCRQLVQITISTLPEDQNRPDLPDIELTATCLRQSLDALAPICGWIAPDDMIGRIFSQFCVGK